MTISNANEYIVKIAKNAKDVSLEVASMNTKDKNNALMSIQKNILNNIDTIITENKKDIEFAISAGKSKAFTDRLLLDEGRIKSMVSSIQEVIGLPDPVGSGNWITRRPNGLKIQKIRVPIGVVAMIYESRPNVTCDASSLTLKSGNTVILRGGKESIHSNIIIANLIRAGLKTAGFPEDSVQLIERTEHEIVDEMLKLNDYIDVVIPRGGESLIKSVIEKSNIPVIKHDKGLCHVFIDESANREKAEKITINAKCQKPSVCNAMETLLIQENYPYWKELITELLNNRLEVRADDKICSIFKSLKLATEEDWHTEYLDYIISVKLVRDVKEAIRHINFYGSHLSDAIVSENYDNIQLFLDRVDSATVYANASTRFTDGGEFGLGTEVGISTQKLHARGPMGLESLTTEKWIIYGNGQIRE